MEAALINDLEFVLQVVDVELDQLQDAVLSQSLLDCADASTLHPEGFLFLLGWQGFILLHQAYLCRSKNRQGCSFTTTPLRASLLLSSIFCHRLVDSLEQLRFVLFKLSLLPLLLILKCVLDESIYI
jgi:hypothetical protein